MNSVFGSQWLGPDVPLTPTPVGMKCSWCDESIAEGDVGEVSLHVLRDGSQIYRPVHRECRVRAALGSVGHQLRKCSCYGGTEEDPEGMTKREAARAAARLVGVGAK